MSKTQVPARNIASKKVIAKKGSVKADSRTIKKTSKSAVPVPSSQSSSQSEKAKKSSQSTKISRVKKASASKENENIISVQPKKPITSYFAFLNVRRASFKVDNPDLSITEIAKGLGKVWAALSEEQKKPYYKVVQDDIARFQKETQELAKKGYFIDKNGENSKDLLKEVNKQKATKTGVQPKKTLSAYMFYNQEISATIRAKNPDAKITEISKIVGEQWSKLNDNEKTKWTNLSQKDKVRHDKELSQLHAKGYFVNSDGVKSTEIVQKKFKYPDGTVMPKRASQAYQIYVKENKDKIIEKNKCTNDEAKQICDQVWNKLTEKQKTKYVNLHEKDVKRYEKQIIQVQTKGYFEQEDGTRSQ